MTDNITLNSGSGGETLATDDIGGKHYQWIKVSFGADDALTKVSSANPLPVDASGNAVPVTDNGANLSVDWNGTVPPIGAGTEAAALRVTMATDTTVSVDTEMPAAAALTDGASNPTLPAVGGFLHGFNGTTWDRLRSTTANGLDVDVTRVQGTVTIQEAAAIDASAATVTTTPAVTGGGTEAAAQRVTLANDSTGVLSVDDGGGSLTIDASELTTLAGAVSGTEMQVDLVAPIPAGDNNIGNVDVATLPSLPAGTNNIGDVDIASALPAGSNSIGTVGLNAETSGGSGIFRSIDLDESEEEIKASAGQVYWIMAFNLSSSVRYLKFYNAAAANVTVGTTTPAMTIPVPTPGDTNGGGLTINMPEGIEFGTGITVAATTGIADNDTGAPGDNEVVVNIGFK